MKWHLSHIAIALLGLALTMPADAQRLPTTSPGPNAAQVNGAPGSVLEDMLPVRIVEVNGRNISPREVLWLEPGRYEFRVQIVVPRSLNFRRSPSDNQRWQRASYLTRRQAMSIELDLEAGKTYQIRVRYNREESEAFPWTTVLWRIEE